MSNLQGNVPLPPKLSMKGNLAQNWKTWKQVWDSFEIVTGLDILPDAQNPGADENKKQNKIRLATFITCIGPEAIEVYNGLPFEDDDSKQNIDTVIKLFESYCVGETNVIYERYLFNNRNQEPGESIDNYSSQLRTLARTCEFGILKDSLIRDRIVCGIRANNVRKRLLQERNLDLKTCIDKCKAAEATEAQVKTMSGQEVHFVKQNKKHVNPKNKKTLSHTVDCRYCGQHHVRDKDKCPARGKKCTACGIMNHIEAVCRSKQSSASGPQSGQNSRQHNHKGNSGNKIKSSRQTNNGQHVRTVEQSLSDYEILTVTHNEDVNSVHRNHSSKIFAMLNVEGTPVNFQIDSGATCNIVPKACVPPGIPMDNDGKLLHMYNDTSMRSLGTCQLKIINPANGRKYKTDFVVIDRDVVPLLGSRAAVGMNLINVQYDNIQASPDVAHMTDTQHSNTATALTMRDIVKDYADVFEGQGCMEGELNLQVDPTVKPVKMPLRRLPLALKESVKQELDRLESLNIITPVDQPTDWISSLLVRKKQNAGIRMCIDPVPLNRALRRNHYPMPVLEDLLPQLSNAKAFTLCDVKNGFWNIKLDEDSSYLTTFETEWGKYRWLRLPQGISPAPEEFQRLLTDALSGLDGVSPVADDILIFGVGDTEDEAIRDHDVKLVKLFERCRQRGIKLNKEKMQLKADNLHYIGHLLSKEGLKPDPDKIRAVLDMPKPTDVRAVQRIIGMVTYLSKFVKGLSDLCEPLRQLTHKNVVWRWTVDHDKAFDKIKQAVSQTPVLKFFSSNEETTLQCDASDTGLGATILQLGQPVAYASRTLTSTERNYAQIEKELLAIIYGLEKYHQITYGRRVTVQTDHQPLVTIYKKSLTTAPKRLQRMLLRLQQYDVELVYTKGRDMHIADTLSRAYLTDTDTAAHDSSEVHSISDRSDFEVMLEEINMVDYLAVSEKTLHKIHSATEADEVLQTLKPFILHGWPEKQQVPQLVMPYYSIRSELSVQDGIIYHGFRCIVPRELRHHMLQRIHYSHLGVSGCLARAREAVYWPGMNSEIKDLVSKCEVCCAMGKAQQKEKLIPHEIPNRPWAKIGTDLCTIGNENYLITVDYYSNFTEVDRIYDKKSKEVITKLKAHMARHGIPDICMSDNGPPFNSAEFAAFAEAYEFNHVTSSPGYSQSNGKVESAVKSVKTLLIKAKQSKSDPYLALLDWRNTPTSATNTSPAMRLYSRRTKTLLPTSAPLLKPQIPENVHTNLKMAQTKQAETYNRAAKDMRSLRPGDVVRIKPVGNTFSHNSWAKGVVVRSAGIRSYEVKTDNGQVLRRNRRHLRLTQEFNCSDLDSDAYGTSSDSDDESDIPMPQHHTETINPPPQPIPVAVAEPTVRRNPPRLRRPPNRLTL